MKVVLLPLKDPTHAKQRLAGHLTPRERQELAWAMFEDVTRAVRAAITPDQVVVVTRGHPALLAEPSNWEVIEENQQISESHSVDHACRLLQQRGASVVLRLPTDIPLLAPEDVETLKLAGMTIPQLQALPEYGLIENPDTLRSKDAMVEAIMEVRKKLSDGS